MSIEEPSDWTAVRSEFLLDQRLAGLSPATVHTYGWLISHYQRWCQAEGVAPVSAQRSDVARYVVEQMDQRSLTTAYHRLVALRCFYHWAKRRGLREDDPTIEIRVKRPKSEVKQPYSDDELRALYAACRTPRERALILCFIATGARLSEIAGMTTDDLRGDAMLLIRGKGNKERWVYLGKAACAALADYLDGREGAVWLADERRTPPSWRGRPMMAHGLYEVVVRLGQRAGVSHTYVHRFRTTFANMVLDRSGNVGSLQMILGHANIAQTLHYAAYNRRQRALELQARLAIGDMFREGASDEHRNARADQVPAPMEGGAGHGLPSADALARAGG